MAIPTTFRQDSKIVEIHEGIYLHKKFIHRQLLNAYTEKVISLSEDDWRQHGNFKIGDHAGTFWGDKCSLDIVSRQFHDEIFNFFAPNYWMYQHDNFVRLKTGQSSSLDNNKRFMNNETPIAEYKVGLYFGDFTGGAISFPNLNFKYQPEHNDLLVFKVSKDHAHLTEEVLSGTRYAYSDCLIPHPGYFMP
jgi:hypothetical protein